MPQALALLAEARELDPLPRKCRRRYGSDLQVVLDRSSRLVPIWSDQGLVADRLQSLLGDEALRFGFVHDTRMEPQLAGSRDLEPYSAPGSGGTLLVLGDLGVLDPSGETMRTWHELGEAVLASGAFAVALVPVPSDRVPIAMRNVWRVISWDPTEASPDEDEDGAVLRLLRLASPAPRIEPGLLRAVRLAFHPPIGALATEIMAWQHPWILSRSSAAATLHPEASRQLRREFARESAVVQRRVLTIIKAWHAHLPPEIWHEAVLSFGPDHPREAFPDPHDPDAAHAFLAAMSGDRMSGRGLAAGPLADAWLARVAERTPPVVFAFDEFAEMVGRLRDGDHDIFADGEIDPLFFSDVWGGEERTLHLAQQGSNLRVTNDLAPSAFGDSPLAAIGTTTGHLSIVVEGSSAEAIADNDPAFWQGGKPPSWAADWGTDEYGAWATFAVETKDGTPIEQRLRWIPPGRFTMGSPSDEEGRFEDEGPQHEVMIAEGFWLLATSVTQALYEAVTGENPSKFKGADRPVEQVSWEDAKRFLQQLNGCLPGLDLVLPSEAQWEFASRAGSMTATYAGDLSDPVMDEIAWYEENSGGETHPVGSKRLNPWGLYDMLGNVFEWCEDCWHESYEGAPLDGSAWIDMDASDSAHRVLRGGSWYGVARHCRAASRGRRRPDYRRDSIGFRPARGQGERSDLSGTVPVEAAWRGRSPASQPEPVAAQALRVVPDGAPATVALPRSGEFRVRSDRAELTFRRLTKPEWASGIGRDRYGLLTEITVGDVTQRLRWIPPGRFTMGSPPFEEGRFDAESPQQDVTLYEGFWLFATPVTKALYEAVTGESPSRFKGKDRPVECVSWDDAQRFLEVLNERVPGLDLVLPSEAQWEYACRAGTEAATYAGELSEGALDEIAWYHNNSGGETHPVALKKPNAWGLFDMLGNVFEWCEDHSSASHDHASLAGSAWINPTADDGAYRVIRGGSWRGEARRCRSAYRDGGLPGDRIDGIGFRPARDQV